MANTALITELGMEKYYPDDDLRIAIRDLRNRVRTQERRYKGLISGYPKRVKKAKSTGGSSSETT